MEARRYPYGQGENFASSKASEGTMLAHSFNFGTWLRLHGFDILAMAAMGAIALGLHYAPPARSHIFPLYDLDGSIADMTLAFPRKEQIIPIYASAIMAVFIPVFFFALFQVRRRSWDDFLTTSMGLLRSVITAATLQTFIKCLIGGLRPHFYDACKPRISPGAQSGIGFANIMYDRSICTGNEKHIDDALKSMPSGHATAAWAGLLFLALYFNAQLKVVAAHSPAYWKMIFFFAPLLGASLLTLVLIVDYRECYMVPLTPEINPCFHRSPLGRRRGRCRHWLVHGFHCFLTDLCSDLRLSFQPPPSPQGDFVVPSTALPPSLRKGCILHLPARHRVYAPRSAGRERRRMGIWHWPAYLRGSGRCNDPNKWSRPSYRGETGSYCLNTIAQLTAVLSSRTLTEIPTHSVFNYYVLPSMPISIPDEEVYDLDSPSPPRH
ncbi:lipid phosphate phosphatase 1, variant 4 [Coprinopsis cinerea AmutBmut pab1-1]|nr:lipid phosphate phosphatase 1, variant 4 [Coprinopsis cinerea AmutBmut pab1-1]